MVSNLYFKGINNRIMCIVKECHGKKVLDIGCIGNSAFHESPEGWLHKEIKKASSELIGIDVDKKSIEILVNQGYDIKFANAENFDLYDKFDVVVAGQVIEHLTNVGKFLECTKKHLRKNGILVLTTSNCVSFYNFINIICLGYLPPFNIEHTHWYDFHTLKRTLESHGFAIEELSYIIPHTFSEDTSFFGKIIKTLIYYIHSLACLFRKDFGQILFVKAVLINE